MSDAPGEPPSPAPSPSRPPPPAHAAHATHAPGAAGRERWRRAAPLVLAAGALLAWSLLGPRLPKDHRVVVRLGEAATRVTLVELAWTEPGGGEPAAGTSLRFAPGAAPRALETTVHLADGPWDVAIAVERQGEPSVHVQRHVDLRPGDLVLPLEAALR